MKLRSPQNSYGSFKCLLVAKACDISIQSAKFEAGKDDNKKEFLELSPMGVYPLLESNLCGGGAIFESNSICRYMARVRNDKCLYGMSIKDKSEIDMWLDYATINLEIPLEAYNNNSENKHIENKIKKDLESVIKKLDSILLRNTFLVNERISISDINLASTFFYYFLSSYTKIQLKPFFEDQLRQNINFDRWFETVTNQSFWKNFCSKQTKSKEGEKEKIKSTKGSETGTSKCGDGEEEVQEKRKEKKVNELDLLPPSTFDLNEWKRVYSNSKDLYGEAMKFFWDKIDYDGFSLYYMKYDKIDGECTVSYITANQLNGFFQRLDPEFRKYSFAVVDVVGENSKFDIQGVWLFRGQDIPTVMKEHVSYEYHKFIKLDPRKNLEQKKLVEDYFCACEKVEGRPISDSKVWK